MKEIPQGWEVIQGSKKEKPKSIDAVDPRTGKVLARFSTDHAKEMLKHQLKYLPTEGRLWFLPHDNEISEVKK